MRVTVLIPLMGRFKGETGERNVLLPLASLTDGGLQIRRWVEALVTILIAEGKHQSIGPALCDKNGFVLNRWFINLILHQYLSRIQSQQPNLIAEALVIEDKYNIHRSFRRGATTQARERKVPEPVIDTNNRWRKVENKSGSLPNLPMAELYTEVQQALGTRLRFSKAL